MTISVSPRLPDHRQYVEQGKSYDFHTIAIHQLAEGSTIIMMEYETPSGERIPLFGVRPFPFQEDGGLTPTVRCFVRGFRPNGIADLVQDKSWLMQLLYAGKAGTTASFTPVAFGTDENSHKTYCVMSDAYGVNVHRYYPKADEELVVGQQVVLQIKAVKEQFLELTRPATKAAPVSPTALTPGKFGSENAKTEFKTSIVYSAKTSSIDPDVQLGEITKEIAAFLNAEGGTLYVGVCNDGSLKGIADDFAHLNEGESDEYNGTYAATADGYELKLRNAVKKILGQTANALIAIEILEDGGVPYCKIDVQPSKEPIYWNGVRIFQRAGNQKQMLRDGAITTFIKLRTADQIKQYISTGPKFGTIVPAAAKFAVPQQPQATAGVPEVWQHFTWYSNGEFSFQKEAATGEDVVRQVMIPKGFEKERLVFCYANGCVNSIEPAKVRAGKTTRRRYKLGYSDKAELLAVFPAHNYDLLAIMSADAAGHTYLKCHPFTDFSVNDSMRAQGASVIPTGGKSGSVARYAKLDIADKNIIPNLMFTKTQTTQTIGVDVNDVRYADEIRCLLGKMGA